MRSIRLIRNVKLGIKSLLLHKLRSVLTMLGVVFGVGSVIAMLAIGEGSKQQTLKEFERMGTNNIILASRKPADADSVGNTGSRTAEYGLTRMDFERIRRSVAGVRRVVPVHERKVTASMSTRRVEIEVAGTTADWFDLIDRELLAGRRFTDLDGERLRPVAVLTEQLARRLLATERVIGQRIAMDDKVLTVVGVIRSEDRLEEDGGTPDADIDAYVPFETYMDLWGPVTIERSAGTRNAEDVELRRMIVEAAETPMVLPLARTIRYLLDRFHETADYSVSVPYELLRQRARSQAIWNLTLGSIAGISLLVGGIGIMNIMLASVTERTREIGIRRAIGAKRGQIVVQFLTEALLLSSVGGLIGIALGALALPFAISYYSGYPTAVPAYAIFLSVGISLLVGCVFGLYPALRAAKLDPIVALRHE